MKTCNRCNIQKTGDNFHSKSALCKPCKKINDAGRERNGDPIREITPAARARKLKWFKSKSDPIKQEARLAVRRAIARGELKPRETCEKCHRPSVRRDGVRAIQAHHYLGYENQLAVMWLCPKCHRAYDAARAPAKADGEGKV